MNKMWRTTNVLR